VVVVAASSWVYVSVCTDGGGRRTEDGRTGETHKEIESLNNGISKNYVLAAVKMKRLFFILP
jgi:hypothetical protein